MANTWSAVGTLILGLAGWLLAAAPALNRTRRRHRLRRRLRQDLDLIAASEQVKLDGSGTRNLRISVNMGLNDLVKHEEHLAQKAIVRRTRARRILEWFAATLGWTLAIIALTALLNWLLSKLPGPTSLYIAAIGIVAVLFTLFTLVTIRRDRKKTVDNDGDGDEA